MSARRAARFDFRLDPVPAETRFRIPPELRAEIDARVAAGKVTICPPMTFARPEWDKGEDAGVRALEVAPGKVVKAGGGWRGERPGVAERRAKILKLADGTRTGHEVAALVGCPRGTVHADLAALRRQGFAPRLKPRSEARP